MARFMKQLVRAALTVVMAVSLDTGAVLAAAPHARSCDRTCLTDIADRYVEALIARDAKKAPFAGNARFTENGQTLSFDDGLWATAEKRDAYHVIVADAPDESVALFQALEEAGQTILLAARLKIVAGSITELETVVARPGENRLLKPDGLVSQPAFTLTVEEGSRVSTTQLRNIADSYFEGLVQATDRLTPFADGCFRMENGTRTANDPESSRAMGRLDCRAQFATGFSKFITRVRERRFPVIDEEHGLVMALVFFDHAGTVPKVTLANGDILVVPAPFNRPYTLEIFELFKVDAGRVQQIEAVLTSVPYGMPSGWQPAAAPAGRGRRVAK